MTASVRYRASVVRNERLPLKARPRSAASLAAGVGIEAGRLLCRSERLRCVQQHVGGLDGKRGSGAETCFHEE